MKYEKYLDEISTVPTGENIKGYLEFFDPRIHEISNNKLIFILPNGKCLFMPYAKKDNRTRQQIEYAHSSYIIRALTQIIKELGFDEKEFIEAYIDTSMRDDIIKGLLEQGVSLLYDCGEIDGNGKLKNKMKRYSIFYKSEELTEEQKKTILKMKGNLEKEKYKMGIYKIFKNLDYSDCLKYVTNKVSNNNEFEINEFYKFLDLQKKHDEHDGNVR